MSAWMWFGLGAFAFVALQTATGQYQQRRRPREIQQSLPAPHLLDQDTEDALKLETLGILTEGPNGDLQSAAVRIICERSVSGPTFGLLLQDISGADPNLRAGGLTALKYLCRSPCRHMIVKYGTFDAVVTALERFLNDPGRSGSRHRPPPERQAMYILAWLLSRNTGLGVKAGVVRRWLAKYPFGSNDTERREAIKKIRSCASDDCVMYEIILHLETNREAKKDMEEAGLIGMSLEEDECERRADTETFPVLEGMPRVRNDTSEERELRRRRREAIVVSDGLQPARWDEAAPRRNDPTLSAEDENAEADMRRLISSVLDIDGSSQALQVSTWRSWIPWSYAASSNPFSPT